MNKPGFITFQLACGDILHTAGISRKSLIMSAAAGQHIPDGTNDQRIQDKQRDEKVHHLEKECYVNTDHL